MLPGTSRALSSKLPHASTHHVQLSNLRQPLLLLHPRSYASVSRDDEHIPVSRGPPPPTVAAIGAPQSSQAKEIHQNGWVRVDEGGRPDSNTPIQDVLRRRVDRLPRSKLRARSALEHSLLEGILATPTFRTARKDIDIIFHEIQAQEANRKEAHLSRMQQLFRSDRIDWARTAKKLLALTHANSEPASGKRLQLRQDFLTDHAGDFEANMWIHRIRTGAEVRILPRTDSDSSMRPVSLQGSPRSVELAEKALRLLQDKFQLSGGRKVKHHIGQVLQTAMVVSVRTFSAHVARLVQHKLPRQVQQDTGETFHERVAAALVRVFLDPAASKYASSYAVQRALAFICQYDELEPTVDILYERTKHLGLKLDVNSFNHLLKQAIARNKEEKVSSLIADMHRAGVSANGTTWVLFFTATQSDEARRAVLSYMIQATVNLTPHERTMFATKLAALRLGDMKDSQPDFAAMVAELDHLFGKAWLDGAVYSHMVHAILSGRKSKVNEISKMLMELPERRGLKIDRHIEIARFALYRRQHRTVDATRDIVSILQKDEKPVSKMCVAYLFMTAWETMWPWPNVCRVLWRHAASHGNILYTMQSVVNGSLLNNTPESTLIWDVWKRNAGSIVAGIDAEVAGFENMFPRLSKHCANHTGPMEWLTVYTPDDGTRDEQISLAYLILNRDLTAWKSYQPMTNKELLDLLTIARQTDLAWKRDKIMTKLTVSELLQHATPIQLKRRDVHMGEYQNAADVGQEGREAIIRSL